MDEKNTTGITPEATPLTDAMDEELSNGKGDDEDEG